MTYKTLLVHLKIGAKNEGLLKITGDIAEKFSAHVIGVSVCQPLSTLYSAMETTYGGGLTEDFSDIDRKNIQRRFDEVEERFREALKSRAAGLEWRSTITNNSRSQYVARQARSADLLITSPVGDKAAEDKRQTLNLDDIVMRAGRPILLVPCEAERLSLDSVVVGWKDKRETRRAISDALPLLQVARKVTIVEVTAAQDMADAKRHIADVVAWLGRHGVSATSRVETYSGVEANHLENIAEECQAGLFVAGAYGHTRVREWVIGGVTTDLLLHPSRPTLISH